MTLYLAIGPPPYELPLAVADSPTELGRMVGTPVDTVRTHICRAMRGEVRLIKYIKVDIGEEDEAEVDERC